jgi:energy-coupling factor transporter transmembrane protein EcfT
MEVRNMYSIDKLLKTLWEWILSALIFFIIIGVVSLFFYGCAPAKFSPIKTPEIKFNQTPHYDVEELLSNIQKPEKMKVLFINNDFKEVNPEDATNVIIIPKEYAKVAALLELCKTYKDIILEQENLVNIHIDTINSLKEFISLEQMKSNTYKELWVNAENAYIQEKYERKLDNVINKITTISIGTIMAILLVI